MSKEIVPIERIAQCILYLRGQKIILDRDLALLYGVETRILNQAVKRNAARFPDDFMFKLSREEMGRISPPVTSSLDRHRSRSQFVILAPPKTSGREIGFYVRERAARYGMHRRQ